MRVEIVTVGTELLLGQIVNTNAALLGERLTLAGCDVCYQSVVGDNLERCTLVISQALARNDAVVVTGGLGPTQDDLTREAIAGVMGVELVTDEAALSHIEEMFRARGRTMSANNARQAEMPKGASHFDNPIGTAPGIFMPVGNKVLYALPGVPAELRAMLESFVIPDLKARMAAKGETSVIVSRTLRTWGLSESELAEKLSSRIEDLDRKGNPTIAFLASGIEGLKVRITAKADDEASAEALLDAEEHQVRQVLGLAVFSANDEPMEQVVADLLEKAGLSLGLAESATGGLIAARLVGIPGASKWFKGAVVAYQPEVKFSMLGVPPGPVVSQEAAIAMAQGAKKALGSDVGLSVTGVAGPDPEEGVEPGIVHLGLSSADGQSLARTISLPGKRQLVRELATISALDLLRRTLLES
jgi:nicotinamide-nucleotide amidase